MRPRPDRLERLPDQYFAALLGRVADAASAAGEPLIDLGRGNPDVPPPPHVAERLAASAAEQTARVHGYPPFRGLPELREAVADRYRSEYGVELDPHREVAVLPGTKTALVELQLVLAERGDTVLLPDPGYPDYRSGAALAGAAVAPLPLDPAAGWAPDFDAAPAGGVAAAYLNYPSNPCAVAAPEGAFAAAVRFAERHGRRHRPRLRLRRPRLRRPATRRASSPSRARRRSASRCSRCRRATAWRAGGSASSSATPRSSRGSNLLSDHVRAGVFAPVQEAAVAALTGPQDTVAERRDLYERRRDRVRAALGPHLRCEGTFYVWLELPPDVTADALLVERRVALAPGEGFGSRGAGFARLSLATCRRPARRGARPAGPGLRERIPWPAMKVGIVVPFSWSYWGGVVEHAENQARALERLGIETRILIGNDPPGRLTRMLHPRTGRHGDLPENVIPVGRSVIVPANGSLPNIVLTPAVVPAPAPDPARGALRRPPPARADDAGDLRRGARRSPSAPSSPRGTPPATSAGWRAPSTSGAS